MGKEKIMKRSSALFLGLFVLLSFPTVALADDHSDNCCQGTVVAAGSSTPGNLETIDDVDYFSLSIDSPGVFYVWTTGSTDTQGFVGQPVCSVPGPGLYCLGESIIAWDEDDGPGSNFHIWACLDGVQRNYLIAVFSQSGQTGDYTLHVGYDAVPQPGSCACACGGPSYD